MTASVRPRSNSVVDVLDAVRELAPAIEARVDEIESARRLPLDLVERLTAVGCFRMVLPASHGGAGSDTVSAMRVFEELSRADASVGWTVMIGSSAWIDLVDLPRSTFDSVFPGDTDVIVGGVFSPTGFAIPVDEGYKVNGRWSFASGCEHCDWLYGNCIDTSSGEPQLRIAVFDPAEVTIEDTWSVSGLRGTGSHHFMANDVVLPVERTFLAFAGPACIDEPVVRIPVPATIALAIASVAVGIARGALGDIVALATDKVPLLASSALAGNPLFQHQLGAADVSLRAARSLLHAEAEEAWATAEVRGEFTAPHRARLRSAAVFATTTASDVVGVAYRAGGGSSLYNDSPLQRRLRDINAVTQHFLMKEDTLTTVGAILAGQEPDLTIF